MGKDLKIGLAFSGGGFRASSFSLGVLSYLKIVTFEDTTLLNKVHALSTISGGTITGARYAIGLKRKESFEQIYKALYEFMSKTNLIDLGLDNLVKKKNKNDKRIKSLITAFADVYDKELFNNAKFGSLLDDDNPIHLKDIAFSATEFDNALQFRFQTTGRIGNKYYNIPKEIAKNIRLADILAASSCFPGGFEPINFPNDFIFPKDVLTSISKKIQDNSEDLAKYPVGLMDGGIVDNQGIDPLLLAEKRMEYQKTHSTENSEEKAFDLLIISDVTSPYMEDYHASKEQKTNFWRRLTFMKLIVSNFIILAASIFGVFYTVEKDLLIWTVILTVLATLNLSLYIILGVIRKLPLSFHVPKIFLNPLNKLLKLKFSIYENMILNRSNSVLKLTNDVFLKQIRRLNYKKIYSDPLWKNRRIMNAIYELRSEKKIVEKLTLPEAERINVEILTPSEEIKKVADKTKNMGTTLWFTKDQLKDGMLDALIACGQFTICWNLLEYILKIKIDSEIQNKGKTNENINENHVALLNCESQIIEHWNKFKENPFWLIEKQRTTDKK